jgi:protein-tyrosine-phosphatase
LLIGIERHFDMSQHRSQQLSRELVSGADLILAMGPHHLERVEALGGSGKTHLLSAYASRGSSERAISDPIGADLDVYRATADELEREIRRVFDRIAAEHRSDVS